MSLLNAYHDAWLHNDSQICWEIQETEGRDEKSYYSAQTKSETRMAREDGEGFKNTKSLPVTTRDSESFKGEQIWLYQYEATWGRWEIASRKSLVLFSSATTEGELRFPWKFVSNSGLFLLERKQVRHLQLRKHCSVSKVP